LVRPSPPKYLYLCQGDQTAFAGRFSVSHPVLGRNYLRRLVYYLSTLENPFEGETMKKLFVLVLALALGTSLSLAQATGGSTDTKAPKTTSGKKATKTHKGHKGGKKGKKSSGGTTTPAPK